MGRAGAAIGLAQTLALAGSTGPDAGPWSGGDPDGIVLLTIEDEAGGFVVFHPFDFAGLELLVAAALMLLRGAWRVAAHRPRRRE